MPSEASVRLGDHEFAQDIAAVTANSLVPAMLEAVCTATGMRFAAVARVTQERWIACSVADRLEFGLKPGDELVLESTLCHVVREFSSEVVIDDVLNDPLYRHHPTPKEYGFRSYLSVPILRPDGAIFGTLCALDPEPNRLKAGSAMDMVRLFAKLIGDALGVEDQLVDAKRALQHERHLSNVQEEFMAILAHDLRNPVTAIRAGLRMVARDNSNPDLAHLISLMDSTARRMNGLVDNLMDHARNRLGGGIILDFTSEGTLVQALQQIILEFRTVAPDQVITASFDLPDAIACDHARLAQLLSNLIANAITHGAPALPIEVSAKVQDAVFILAVSNQGKPIPADEMPELFAPFHKGSEHSSRNGLGLGLHIAAEIAKAHGGRMRVTSDVSGTVFSFEMPLTS